MFVNVLVVVLVVQQSVILFAALWIVGRLALKGLSQQTDSVDVIDKVLASVRPVLVDPAIEQQRIDLQRQQMMMEAQERRQDKQERLLETMYAQVQDDEDYSDGLAGDFLPAHAPDPNDPNQKTFQSIMNGLQ